eukprot:TRINITY_DN4369_c0_g1_i1.p1 TRINITY_DN4369_c0_g1~~TRINITY_DN4369_c0_g1_i1.p1  ORF type:complete len:676 (-),score=118.72 TRINITY_DN4369_c0_g1_i1:60-2087(-)
MISWPLGAAEAITVILALSVGSAQSQERELQAIICDDAARWSQLQWEHLSFQESQSWSKLGWEREMWDAAHPIPEITTLVPTTTFGRRLRGGDYHPIGAEYDEDFRRSSLAGEEEEQSGEGDSELWRKLQAGSLMTTTQTPTTTSTTIVPETESMCFQDLTEVQQDAVRTLGYSISKWHTCKNELCPWPQGIPVPSAQCLTVLDWLEDTLFTRDWVDLTQSKRDALELLGWSHVRWQVMDYPLAYAKMWYELMPRQQEAARFLGYTAEVWERCEKAAPCIQRLEILETAWSKISWVSMLQPFQDRLRELGYNEKRWTNGDSPTINKDYVDLTPGQKVSVRLAGYVSDTWDGCPLAQCEERFAYVKKKYVGIHWMQMSVAQRRAWTLLGHSEQLWTDGGMMNTIMLKFQWKELSIEQREQALFLGHSEGTWQGCNSDWGKPVASNKTDFLTSGFISDSIERTVRARMSIRRPFAEVSGNVYGAAVSKLPTSFIQVFEEAVARALFCKNPPLSEDPKTYIGVDGNPLCIQKETYTTQRHRVKVMSVVEGSILVDFFVARNQTASESAAPELYNSLIRMLQEDTSPLCQDMHFGKFARAGSVEEIPLSHLSEDELAQAAEFENMRGKYGPDTACELLSDAREGKKPCGTTAVSSTVSLTGVPGCCTIMLFVFTHLMSH